MALGQRKAPSGAFLVCYSVQLLEQPAKPGTHLAAWDHCGCSSSHVSMTAMLRLLPARPAIWISGIDQSGQSPCNIDLPFAVVQLKYSPSGMAADRVGLAVAY